MGGAFLWAVGACTPGDCDLTDGAGQSMLSALKALLLFCFVSVRTTAGLIALAAWLARTFGGGDGR